MGEYIPCKILTKVLLPEPIAPIIPMRSSLLIFKFKSEKIFSFSLYLLYENDKSNVSIIFNADSFVLLRIKFNYFLNIGFLFS